MTTLLNRGRTLVLALAATALAAGAGGALASPDHSADYGSPQRVQQGYGPAGPPADSATRVVTATTRGAEYGSAELLQLGYGPGGPSGSAGS
jgi:hypothetical protein